MQLLELSGGRDFEGHHLHLRIGIATGPISAGTVGGNERLTYTLYGDTVNLAQRLERLNKEFGTSCLVSGDTIKAAPTFLPAATAMGSVQVRGRERTVEVFAFSA